MKQKIAVCWLRRDLRLHDNAALYHALRSPYPVLPLFIFDREILDDLSDRDDARVTFIHQQINGLQKKLADVGASMLVRYGRPSEIWQQLLNEFEIAAVFTNRDYEPYALQRDQAVAALLAERKASFHTFKDQVIFEAGEVLKDDGKPYTVFTPYSRKWLAKLDIRVEQTDEGPLSFYLKSWPTEPYFSAFFKSPPLPVPTLEEMGFVASATPFPPDSVPRGVIRQYDKTRDLPALENGTSKLGIHFRFGTISIREKARAARALNDTYLNELIWRDFYSQILAHFPHVVDGPFKAQYARIPWRNAPDDFQKWCEGRTGYPLVDAGMRQLNATGYMHNRVRMVVASFLTKHLLINWQMGEAYFAQKLLDFDLASNSGGWQWAAGCGTDAAPYFRVFNPLEQAKKFDPEGRYIRRWVPEFGTPAYPKPVVDHAFARVRCLEVFKKALDGAST